MVRQSLAVALVAFGLARDPGCGGAEPSGGLHAPCTRSKDCSASLVCAEGVCTDLDAGSGPDGGGLDAASSGDAADDGG